MIFFAHASGQDSEFIDFSSLEVPVHRALVQALIELKTELKSVGISLGLASGYRSFDRQLNIWNEKANGLRPLFDADGQQLQAASLDEESLLKALLCWSALPGLSRHHWGSEVDVVDAAVVARGYCPQLVPQEYCKEGAFAALGEWLDNNINQASVFYRPYQVAYDVGVAPEAWHLSYKPLAKEFSQVLTLDALGKLIADSDIALKEIILNKLEWIYTHYAQRYFDVSHF